MLSPDKVPRIDFERRLLSDFLVERGLPNVMPKRIILSALAINLLLSGCGGGSISPVEAIAVVTGAAAEKTSVMSVLGPIASQNLATEDWTTCAREGMACVFKGPASVRYGANGKYVTLEASDRITCSNSVFGDPAPGVGKSCSYRLLASQATDWMNCGTENQQCQFLGPASVRYGGNGKYVTFETFDGITCGNSLFGDPAPGVGKSCSYRRLASPATATVAFSPTPSVAPSLAGLPSIPSNFDTSSYLWTNLKKPATMAPDVVGAFRFNCTPTHNAYDDPVVYPGQPGKSPHLHTFFGNTLANGNSTYASLRSSGQSSCNNILNRSAYWIPAMMNGRGKVVMPDFVSIYYKRRPSSDPECQRQGQSCIALPRGLRFVFGYNMSTDRIQENGSFYFNCQGGSAVSGHFANLPLAAKGCPVGSQIGAVIGAPDCWDGKNLDSPDHRSHMAYGSYGGWGYYKCPATHPFIVPTFQLGAWYTVDATLDRSGNTAPDAQTWYLASDRMTGMQAKTPGTTLHADWYGAWDDNIMASWTTGCINGLLSCSAGELGNGQQMKSLKGYSYATGTKLVDVPAR